MAVVTLTADLAAAGSLMTSLALALGHRIADEEVVRRTAARLGWDINTAAGFDESLGGIGRRLRESLVRQTCRGVAGDPWFPVIGASFASGGHALTDTERWTHALRLTVEELADEGDVIIAGHGAQAILAGRPGVLHVRVSSSVETCTERLAQRALVPVEAARKQVVRSRHERELWHSACFGIDYRSPEHYALVLNADAVREDDAVRAVLALLGPWASVRGYEARTDGRADCPHPALRVSSCSSGSGTGGGEPAGYWCDMCGTPFTPSEARRIRRERRYLQVVERQGRS